MAHAYYLLPSVINARIFPLLNPFRAPRSSTFRKISVTANGGLRASAASIFHVRSSADPLPAEEKHPPSSRIFIKGLSRSTSEGYLLKQFSQFGEINKVKIVTSRGSQESLGMAYILFACKESAELAIKEMNGKVYCRNDFYA